MDKKETRRVTTPLGEIEYTLERKPVKNINVRVRADNSVYASANAAVPAQRVDAFIVAKAQWIDERQRVNRIRSGDDASKWTYADGDEIRLLGEPVRVRVTQAARSSVRLEGDELLVFVRDPASAEQRKKAVRAFLRARCEEVYADSIRRQLPLLARWGVTEPALKISTMPSTYGYCCKETHTITMAMRLIAVPVMCIDYVVLHEMCHFVHFDHSRAFHALMDELMPDWLERKFLTAMLVR